MSWSNEDPRDYFSNCSCRKIVICRPNLNGHLSEFGLGWIYTNDGWHLFTDFEDHKQIETWDSGWYWTTAPKE